MTSDILAARTFLFVPGDRPDRFAKATACSADIVILDLEDAVSPDTKGIAREHVRSWLDQGNHAIVRINAIGTPWYTDDVALITGCSTVPPAIMVPKAEDPGSLESLSRSLPPGTGIIPLIETAGGIMNAAALCAQAGVLRPAFGSVDLATQLHVDHRSHDALLYARSALVLAAATAGCAAPVDGVTTNLTDDSPLRADLEHAVSLGFTGKLCIHPRQVIVANRCLVPTDADVVWARGILARAQGKSVTVHDGQMIDRPLILRAQAILTRAGQALYQT
jgi:citrate lyase subunit beta/citryl-CoA lyase